MTEMPGVSQRQHERLTVEATVSSRSHIDFSPPSHRQQNSPLPQQRKPTAHPGLLPTQSTSPFLITPLRTPQIPLSGSLASYPTPCALPFRFMTPDCVDQAGRQAGQKMTVSHCGGRQHGVGGESVQLTARPWETKALPGEGRGGEEVAWSLVRATI